MMSSGVNHRFPIGSSYQMCANRCPINHSLLFKIVIGEYIRGGLFAINKNKKFV
jgi:hypothetical protein